MQNSLERMLAKIFADRAKRKKTVAVVSMLSVAVVISVFWQLMQPVVTQTADPVCGMEAHLHNSDCYASQLVCRQEADEAHAHSESCYQSVLACGLAEHSHADDCYPKALAETTLAPDAVSVETAVPEQMTEAAETAAAEENPAAAQGDADEESGSALMNETDDGTELATEATATVEAMTGATATTETTTEATATVEAAAEATATTEATAEPIETETPAIQAALSEISASAESVQVGETVVWNFECSNAEKLNYIIKDEAGAEAASGELTSEQRQVSWLADRAGRFSMELTASNAVSSQTRSVSVEVREAQELKVSVSGSVRSCFAGGEVSFHLERSGDAELTACSVKVMQGETVLAEWNEWTDTVTVTAAEAGSVTMITATVSATDAAGVTATASCEIPCAVREEEREWQWAESTRVDLGMEWPVDLIAVAETQLGYDESEINFVIDEDGEVQGYTRYGDWYGSSYADWCGMYVSFCLNYAEIPESYFPREANCVHWVNDLKACGLYASAGEYEPKAGNLIFIDWEENGYSDHVGIITEVTEDKIYTIEGNTGKSVRREKYDIDDGIIAGYGLIDKAYERYAANLPEVNLESGVGGKAIITADVANLRAEATTTSEIVGHVEEEQIVDVLAAEQTGKYVWYRVSAGEQTGYVRGDLLSIMETSATVEATETVEPSATAEVTETVEPSATAEVTETVEPSATAEATETVEPGAMVEATDTVEPGGTEGPAQADGYAVLMAELQALAENGYTAEQVYAIEERREAAYESGMISEAEYDELIILTEMMLGTGTMTLEEDETEISKATRYKNSNSKYGVELSVKFIPVDASGNERSDVKAPNTVRYYFDYAEWSSEKTVSTGCSAITDVMTSEEVYDTALISMSTGARLYDAKYAKVNSSGYLYCGSSYASSKAITGNSSTQYVYMAVYYVPAELTVIFQDDAGETISTTTGERGGTAAIPTIEGYEINAQNADGLYLTGWQTADGAVYGTAIDDVQDGMVLKPVWSETMLTGYTVSFDIDGVETQVSAFDGQKIAELSAPDATKDGYRFDGWFDESGVMYAAETAITGNVTLYARYTELIEISFVISNSDYTADPGSGYTHVTVNSTSGLNSEDFDYDLVGTGDRYRVYGTGTLATFTIPSGESLQDNGLSMVSVNVENQQDNGTDNNTYTYVSAYSWVDESGMVCNAGTAFAEDTTLYLRLYESDEKYYLSFVCCENCANSVSFALSEAGVSYPSAIFAVNESVAAEYIPAAADVNAYFACESCGYGAAYKKVLDYWYILDQSGNQVALSEGVTIEDIYLPGSGDTITVYAAWKDAPNTVAVTFKDADGTVLSANSEAACYSAFVNLKPADPAKDGCAFVGWTTDGGETMVSDTAIITADAEFTAVYDATITVRIPDLANGDLTSYTASTLTVRTGKTLTEARDAEGNSISAPAFENGYLFSGWLVEGDTQATNDLSTYLVTDALTVTAQYEAAYTLSFCYQTEESAESVTAATLYVKAGGTIYEAVDAQGNPVGGTLPTIQVPGYTFNYWTDANGNRFQPSYSTTFNANAVYTANLTRLTVVSFQEIDFADADGDSDTAEYITTNILYLAGGNALSTAVDAAGNAISALPVGASANGKTFLYWTADGETQATLDTVISADTSLTAKYEGAPVVTFNHLGTTYSYTVTSGTTFAQALVQAAADETNPLPLDAIEADQMIVVDGAEIKHRFIGWSYTTITANLDTENVLATDSLTITGDMEFIAAYEAIGSRTVVLHDIGPDGAEQGGVSIDLLIPDGDTAAEYLADVTLADGAGASEVIWYTVSADGTKTRFDAAQPVTTDLELYTYTYQMVLMIADANAASVMTLSLEPEVEVSEENGTITITLREGAELSAADFVIDGVDYSLYTWTNTATGETISLNSLIGQTLSENITATSDGSLTGITKNDGITIQYYLSINGTWQRIATGNVTYYQFGETGRYFLTVSQLEAVYGAYGFKANEYGGERYFPHADGNNANIWGDVAPIQQNGIWCIPVGDSQSGSYMVYYTPARPLTVDDKAHSSGSYNIAKTNTEFAAANTFYSITVADESNRVYEDSSEIPAVSYVLTGSTATVTVKTPAAGEDGITPVWTATNATLTEVTDNDDGTTTYTLSNVTSAVTLTPILPEGSYSISYNINIEGTPTGTVPTIEGGVTFEEVFDSTTGNDYIVRTPSETRYTTAGTNSLVTNTFEGWIVNNDENSVLAAGQILTVEEIAAYAPDGELTLKAKWSNQGNEGSVSFYINLALQVADYNGSTEDTPDENYTGAVYGTKVNVNPEPTSYGYADVLQADDKNATAAIDATIRTLISGVKATYMGNERTFTLDSFPDDEAVLATVRSMQAQYIDEFKASAYYSASEPFAVSNYRTAGGRIISENGQYIPWEEITSDNYTVRWYVFKYDQTNGWHIDGVLVKKQGQLTVTKTFYGNDAAIQEVKEKPYTITVQDSSNNTLYTLNLNEQTTDNANGYVAYDSATDTYTWTITLTQGATYKLFENNYEAANKVEIGEVEVAMASLSEYMVTNASGDEAVSRRTYAPDSGVTVTARAYANDLNYTNFKTVKFYNSYIPTNTMLLSKVDDNGAPLSNVTFQLKKDGTVQPVWRDEDGVYYIYDPTSSLEGVTEYSNGYITTNALGYAMVIGLKDSKYAGSYSLTEVEAPEGYNKITTEIQFGVGSDGVITLAEHPNAQLINGLNIQITNTSETISVTARKVWTDGTNKEVQVALCLDGTPMSAYTATLNAANSWTYTWTDIPAYIGGELANYTLREMWIGDSAYSGTIDDGYADYVVTYANPVYSYDESGKPTGLTLTVSNRTYTGGVEFTKVDENGNALPGAVFAVYTLYTDEECEHQYGSAQESAEDGKVSFGNLAAGTYYMKETAAPDGYLEDNTVYKIVVSGSGTKITRIDDADGASVTSITNYPSTTEVTVVKVDSDSNPLQGATFQLTLGGAAQTVNGTNNATFSPAGDSASFTIEGLESSEAEYAIKETDAPAGYYGMSGEIKFKVTNGEVVVEESTLPGGVSWNEDTNTFTVTNTPGTELPSTGGSGTFPYAIGGLLIMAVSLLCGIGLRRKRERGEAV